MKNLFVEVERCLMASNLEEKLELTRECLANWNRGELACDSLSAPEPISEPGRPPRPQLVKPSELPRRSTATKAGRAALIHAVCHIEFNAINLALDAVYRFRDLPAQFYSDWLRIAAEEADHFEMMRKRLRSLEFDYGDFPGHTGLWDMARKTADDPLIRMALVPRLLEARGLDVNPGIARRLERVGDVESVAALEIILRDEIGHVRIGSTWYKYFCTERGLNPEETFRRLIKDHFAGELRGPFHHEAREQAGFSREELLELERLEKLSH